jgi:putative salt-induced outer membrane protein YdiY
MADKIFNRAAGCVGLMTVMMLLALAGRAETWVLANGDRLTGELMGGDAEFIQVKHPQLGRLTVPRSALQAPASASHLPLAQTTTGPAAAQIKTGVQPEIERWKRQMEVGYAQQSGTKEKQDLSVRLQVDGKEGENTFRGTARLLQAELDGVTVTERSEADFRWRYDINKRLFAQSLTTYAADEVRKVDLSLEQQVGGGLKVLDSSRHKANVGLGAVVQYLDRMNTDEQTALLGSLFQDYAYQWNSRVKLVQESSLMMSETGALNVKGSVASAPTEGSYRLKFNTGVQSKVSTRMSLNVRFEYDYDRSVLESDLRADQRLTTSLGYIW